MLTVPLLKKIPPPPVILPTNELSVVEEVAPPVIAPPVNVYIESIELVETLSPFQYFVVVSLDVFTYEVPELNTPVP